MGRIEDLKEKIRPFNKEEPYVFISYSKKDAEAVYEKVISLQDKGVNLWIDKELDETAGTAWNENAYKAIKNTKCKKLLFFMSVDSFYSVPVCAELVYTLSEAVTVPRNNKPLPIVPVTIPGTINMGTIVNECKKDPRSSEKLAENELKIFSEGMADRNNIIDEDSERLHVILKTYKDCFNSNPEITVVSSIEDILKNIQEAVTAKDIIPTWEELQEKSEMTGEVDLDGHFLDVVCKYNGVYYGVTVDDTDDDGNWIDPIIEILDDEEVEIFKEDYNG